jgi:hypothetical protein
MFSFLRIGRSIISRVFHDRVCLQKIDLITDFLLFKQVYPKNKDLSQTIEEVCKYCKVSLHTWAAPWQNQHNGFANSMDPAWIQTSMRIHAVWSGSMLFAISFSTCYRVCKTLLFTRTKIYLNTLNKSNPKDKQIKTYNIVLRTSISNEKDWP